MKGKLVVLVAICLASTLGLISLGVSEPMTFTLTYTQHVMVTGSQSITLTVTPIIVLTVTDYPCIWLEGFPTVCYTQEACNQLPYQPPTCYVATAYTTSALSGFTYTAYFQNTPTYQCNMIGCSWSPLSTTWVTYTYSPGLSMSTSVATSVVTSPLTQTGYITKQMTPITTGSAYQEEAGALAIVLAVSLLMTVLNSQKGKDP